MGNSMPRAGRPVPWATVPKRAADAFRADSERSVAVLLNAPRSREHVRTVDVTRILACSRW